MRHQEWEVGDNLSMGPSSIKFFAVEIAVRANLMQESLFCIVIGIGQRIRGASLILHRQGVRE